MATGNGLRQLAIGALALLAPLAGCVRVPPATLDPVPPSVCYECLWVYEDPVYGEVVQVYEGYQSEDPVVMADIGYLLARMHQDPEELCDAFVAFHHRRRARGPQRRLYVAETLAFTAAECGRDPAPYFLRASRLALRVGQKWKAQVYESVAQGRFEPTFGVATISTSLDVPEDTAAFVLGETAIRVDPGARLGVQMERTVRDWLSYQMEFDFSPSVGSEDLLWYHEGARVKDILGAVPVEVIPLAATVIARSGDQWFAPDENGVFRFGVLHDKVEYPTTRAWGDLGLMMDTHGISSLVEGAVRNDVDLVVGCGDHVHKSRAAYHLATLGIDVYFPCDRQVGKLLGHDAPGVLLGSAPVREEDGAAVIGDRPVTFRTDEILVVADSSAADGPYQYYDAPAHYFRRLAEALPLRIEWVQVDGPGDSLRLVQRAVDLGATVVAVRVEVEKDYSPVRDWLAGAPERRAVLFHSAPYPAGYRLFEEFPGQTTFGDPRPRFLTAAEMKQNR